jgi:CRISPR-associated protein Csd2
MAEPIKNRYEFIILFDVENGNPNGDPDAGNMPRIDPETNLGLVTDVCLKRKIRSYVETVKEDQPGYRIYIKDSVPLNTSDRSACEYLKVPSDDKGLKEAKKNDKALDGKIRDFMCQNFYDVRTFGAVMTTFVKAALNCGQVRGPVQLGFARSVEPVIPQEITITRVAITTEEDAEKKGTEMGRKFIVPMASTAARAISRPTWPARRQAFRRMIWLCYGTPFSICLRTTIPPRGATWLSANSSFSGTTASWERAGAQTL